MTFGDIYRHLATFTNVANSKFGEICRHLVTFIRQNLATMTDGTKFRLIWRNLLAANLATFGVVDKCHQIW